MMIRNLCLFICITLSIQFNSYAQLTVEEVGTLPESVANNAVCEGFIDDVPYLFSFGGIDSTKIYSGIHLKSFKINLDSGDKTVLSDLPDQIGKIAMGASRIGNIIYIIGGYNVFANGSEASSNKLHRYDILNDEFLEDGAPLPVATDDHVQAIWRDSLIYVISGWSNTTNINRVQIYNPSLDEWQSGTSTPNTNFYKSFGASGVIKNDQIIYFGGALSVGSFGVQNEIRYGDINPNDPSEISWSIETIEEDVEGYRMASSLVHGQPHWIGGSNNTYNFDGIAYDGSGGVPPNNRDLTLNENGSWSEQFLPMLPMDLRGIAVVNDSVQFIAGGMLENQEVTNKVYKLTWKKVPTSIAPNVPLEIFISPNPASNYIHITSTEHNQKIDQLKLYNSSGTLLLDEKNKKYDQHISVEEFPSGIYTLEIVSAEKKIVKRISIIRN